MPAGSSKYHEVFFSYDQGYFFNTTMTTTRDDGNFYVLFSCKIDDGDTECGKVEIYYDDNSSAVILQEFCTNGSFIYWYPKWVN